MRNAPNPKDVLDFQFKQTNICQIFDGFTLNAAASNLVAADGKRGLLYIGHNNKLTVLKPGNDAKVEWKIDLDIPDTAIRICLNCDCTFLAIAFARPSVLIYNASSLAKNSLEVYHEIRISTSGEDIQVIDMKWNPVIPGMLTTVATDYTIGSFQIKGDKAAGINITALEKLPGLEALCVAWSPKGKQLVIGCRNGNIVQLKPDLKVARTIPGPSPSIGGPIAIVWLSVYQFCAAYLDTNDQNLSVVIVDAPKNQAVSSFTRYEDIMYRMPDVNKGFSRFYFDHIAEWGIIIAASNDCSEIAVLGSIDNGTTWEQWQLVDSGRAELPLVRTNESYPIGIAIDKSSTQKLTWEGDTKLSNPSPILHILGTSGQLCSFYIINLKPGCPNICAAPAEIVTPPPAPRPSIAPSEISFTLPNGATSTPLVKQNEVQMEKLTNPPMTNLFGTSSNTLKAVNFATPQKQLSARSVPTSEQIGSLEDTMKTTGFTLQSEPKTTASQNEIKIGFQMPLEVSKNTGQLLQTENVKNINFSSQVQVKTADTTKQVDNVITKPKAEKAHTLTTKAEVKPAVIKETEQQKINIDDSICLRAYREEQTHFEQELKNKTQCINWECGSEEERRQLIEKLNVINDFLKELRDTTNSLANDISYLKSLLLQSFAWLEETKSKSSSYSMMSSRSRNDSTKLEELQQLLYYTQSQLLQVTRALDLEWVDRNSREKQKMKIPNMEFIYQGLMRHGQIIAKQKNNLDLISRKLKSFGKKTNISGLNRSMSNLNISSSSPMVSGSEYGIELKCKTIANKTRCFSREKQIKLIDLLTESTPRIVKPVTPTEVQKRLKATLSSLTSISKIPTEAKPKVEQNFSKNRPLQMKVQQSPLPSLNNMVARIGADITPMQQSVSQATTVAPSSTSATKISPLSLVTTQTIIPKQKTTISFGQNNTVNQPSQMLTFPKLDSISFGSSAQKGQDSVLSSTKDNVCIKSKSNTETPKSDNMSFSNLSIKSLLSTSQESTIPAPSTITSFQTTSSTATFSSSAPMFSLQTPLTTNLQSFSFSNTTKLMPTTFAFGSSVPTTTITSVSQHTNQSQAQGSLDLSGLSMGLQQPEFPINLSLPQTTTTAPMAPLPSPLLFQTPQTSLFAKTAPTTTSSPSSIASGMVIAPAFCRTATTTATAAASKPDKVSVTGPSSSTAFTITTAAPVFGSTMTFTNAVSTTVSSLTGTTTQTTSTTKTAAVVSAPSATATIKPLTTTVASTFSFLAASTASTTINTTTTTSTTISAFSDSKYSTTPSLTFGTSTSSVTITPVYGKSAPDTTTSNIFAKSTSDNSLPFGSASLGSSNTSVFGSTNNASANTSIFGRGGTIVFGSTAATTTVTSTTFGSVTNTTTSNSPTFGNGLTVTVSPSVFSSSTVTTTATTSAPIFGSATVPTTSTTTSIFGSATITTTASTSTIVFGSTTITSTTASSPIFGSASVTTTTASSLSFGSTPIATTTNKPNFDTVTTTLAATSPSVFASNATSGALSTPLFGGTPASTTSSSIFGSPTSNTSGTSIFGGTPTAANTANTSPFGAKSPTTTPSNVFSGGSGTIFGTAGQTSIFGDASKTQGSMFGGTGSSVFGTTSQAVTSLSGSSVMSGQPQSVFGQPATFGAKPFFGATTNAEFGMTPVFGSGFGTPAFGTGVTPAGFGSLPTLGSGLPPQMGTTDSMQKVFGGSTDVNTFENLAGQSGGLSFSSLAQKTSEPEKPPAFSGGSSFSSWR